MRRLLTALIVCIIFANLVLSHQPVQAAPAADVNIIALMDDIEAYLREAKFLAGTTRQGSVYLYDMKTRHQMSVNGDVTYSAASVSKIAVMLAFFQNVSPGNTQLSREYSILLSKMMLCSDNAATNELIKIIGGGNLDKAFELISYTLYPYEFTLKRTFSSDGTPDIIDGPVIPNNADADLENQARSEQIGWMFRDIVQCTGESIACKKMLALMRANKILNLIEGGVPEGIPVAHKQGWVQDTHGDAAYITTPGGDYILVIFLHQRKFLQSVGSFPVMAEISRRVYNAYNPNAPLKAIRSQPIPKECKIPQSVIADLMK
jgi:beta-lactamase class A